MSDINTADVIKDLRLQSSLTQLEFAAELGISRSALTQLEAGKTKPGYDVLKVLFEKFALLPEDIFGLRNSEQEIDSDALRSIERITAFWATQYRVNYSPLAEDLMVSRIIRGAPDHKGGDALLSLLNNYRKVLRFTNTFEREFLDPLKRITLLVNQSQEAITFAGKFKDSQEEMEKVHIKIVKLLDDAIYFNETDAFRLDDIEDDFCRAYVNEKVDLPSSLKMFQYSQEKYLRAFFYLLEQSELLTEVAEFYENEDLYRR